MAHCQDTKLSVNKIYSFSYILKLVGYVEVYATFQIFCSAILLAVRHIFEYNAVNRVRRCHPFM